MEVTIARAGRWIVTAAAGIAVILGTRKDLIAIAVNLNGWHVLAIFSGLVLIVIFVDSYRRSLNKRFAALATKDDVAGIKAQLHTLGIMVEERYKEFHAFRDEVINFMNEKLLEKEAKKP